MFNKPIFSRIIDESRKNNCRISKYSRAYETDMKQKFHFSVKTFQFFGQEPADLSNKNAYF